MHDIDPWCNGASMSVGRLVGGCAVAGAVATWSKRSQVILNEVISEQFQDCRSVNTATAKACLQRHVHAVACHQATKTLRAAIHGTPLSASDIPCSGEPRSPENPSDLSFPAHIPPSRRPSRPFPTTAAGSHSPIPFRLTTMQHNLISIPS